MNLFGRQSGRNLVSSRKLKRGNRKRKDVIVVPDRPACTRMIGGQRELYPLEAIHGKDPQ